MQPPTQSASSSSAGNVLLDIDPLDRVREVLAQMGYRNVSEDVLVDIWRSSQQQLLEQGFPYNPPTQATPLTAAAAPSSSTQQQQQPYATTSAARPLVYVGAAQPMTTVAAAQRYPIAAARGAEDLAVADTASTCSTADSNAYSAEQRERLFQDLRRTGGASKVPTGPLPAPVQTHSPPRVPTARPATAPVAQPPLAPQRSVQIQPPATSQPYGPEAAAAATRRTVAISPMSPWGASPTPTPGTAMTAAASTPGTGFPADYYSGQSGSEDFAPRQTLPPTTLAPQASTTAAMVNTSAHGTCSSCSGSTYCSECSQCQALMLAHQQQQYPRRYTDPRSSVIYVLDAYDPQRFTQRTRPRNDPVAKFQALQRVWNKDKFLSQQGRRQLMWETRHRLAETLGS